MMSPKLRCFIFVLGLLSTGSAAVMQDSVLLRAGFVLAACIWAAALGALAQERIGKRSGDDGTR
jgi:hypothetical protein